MLHKFSLFGYNIALDTESGSIHELSDIAYKMTGYIEKMAAEGGLPDECPYSVRYGLAQYEAGEVRSAYADLASLYREGMLFTKAPAYYTAAPVSPMIKAMCLYVADCCNLKCGYCFAMKSFGERDSLMSLETGKQAVDFLLENSGARKNLEADFFGGEPLLNFAAVRGIVDYAREREKGTGKHISFTLTTNGTLLTDEIIAYINENIDNVVLSLDGPPEVNDAVRVYHDGGGSYERIVPLYQKLTADRGNKSYYVRGTYTKKNLRFANDVLHLASLGFKHISVEPVISGDPAYAITEEDLPVIFSEYEKLAAEIIRRDGTDESFNFFHFNMDTEDGPCVFKRVKGCGAGCEYVAVTTSGEIYPCHQFIGESPYLMGSLGAEVDTSASAEFLSASILSKDECAACFAKYFCGGGCAANNYKYCGNIGINHAISCDLMRKRVECALAIKTILSLKNAEG